MRILRLNEYLFIGLIAKNVVICNVYRPSNGKLDKATRYLDDCLKTVNMSKVNVFMSISKTDHLITTKSYISLRNQMALFNSLTLQQGIQTKQSRLLTWP